MSKIVKDNIITSLQKFGGISYYWDSLYKNNSTNEIIKEISDKKWKRIFNVNYDLEENHIFHSSYYRISKNTNSINITTLHDLVHEYFFFGLRKHMHIFQKYRALKGSQGIICISENTKNDLIKFYPSIKDKNIEVIYNGFKPLNFPAHNSIKKLENKQFYLFVGSRYGYKNFLAAVNISMLTHEFLVIAGGGPLTRNERSLLEYNLKGEYLVLPFVNDPQLKWLYQNALLFIYPSLYEGFGMPPLEALFQGCNVFCLETSITNEIYSDFIPLFNSKRKDIIDFVKKIIKTNSLPKKSELLKKYNWKRTAYRTFKFMNECS